MIGRWLTALVAAVVLTASLASAGEPKRIEGDEAKKLAEQLIEASGKLDNLPLKVMPDATKSVGVAADKRAALVVPDSRLKLEAIKKLGSDVVPIGMLYTHRITLVVADQATPAEQHRTVEITAKKEEKVKVAVMHLAVAKVADRPVLLIYTSGKTPALVTTLVETDDAKDLPLELEAKKGGGDSQATVILTVLGKYRAAFGIAAQD